MTVFGQAAILKLTFTFFFPLFSYSFIWILHLVSFHYWKWSKNVCTSWNQASSHSRSVQHAPCSLFVALFWMHSGTSDCLRFPVGPNFGCNWLRMILPYVALHRNSCCYQSIIDKTTTPAISLKESTSWNQSIPISWRSTIEGWRFVLPGWMQHQSLLTRTIIFNHSDKPISSRVLSRNPTT